MLTIRREQMHQLVAQQRLEMVLRHAHKFFPAECSKLEPEGVERTAQSALERASEYGLKSLRDSLQFVDLVLTLGPEFDRNLPWAREILEDRSGERARFRSSRLYLRARQHLRQNV